MSEKVGSEKQPVGSNHAAVTADHFDQNSRPLRLRVRLPANSCLNACWCTMWLDVKNGLRLCPPGYSIIPSSSMELAPMWEFGVGMTGIKPIVTWVWSRKRLQCVTTEPPSPHRPTGPTKGADRDLLSKRHPPERTNCRWHRPWRDDDI